MKTNSVPSIIMLLAGLIYCLISISQGTDLMEFTVRLLAVLVIFYIIGSIVKVIIDINFKDFGNIEETEEENNDENSGEEVENIETSETQESVDDSTNE